MHPSTTPVVFHGPNVSPRQDGRVGRVDGCRGHVAGAMHGCGAAAAQLREVMQSADNAKVGS